MLAEVQSWMRGYRPHLEGGGNGAVGASCNDVEVLCSDGSSYPCRRHRELLSGAQRLLQRSCLYYALPPGQAPPDMLEVLQQVPPRHRLAPVAVGGDSKALFSLYVFTRKAAFMRKRAVNSQVRVGQSGWRKIRYR